MALGRRILSAADPHFFRKERTIVENKPEAEQTATLDIKDLGAATDKTHGSALLVPFYENGVPPYDHLWPVG